MGRSCGQSMVRLVQLQEGRARFRQFVPHIRQPEVMRAQFLGGRLGGMVATFGGAQPKLIDLVGNIARVNHGSRFLWQEENVWFGAGRGDTVARLGPGGTRPAGGVPAKN